jgi:cytidylate kinase
MSTPVPHWLVERAVKRFEAQTGVGVAVRPRVSSEQHEPATARVITISRQLGSGGKRIADGLSERLGLPVWDREILDELAAQSGRNLQARLFESLDERARGHVHALIEGWLTGIDTYQYDYLLPRAILAIAQKDAIIVGRGAHLFLPESLRVRIVAPPSVRVENLMRFEQLSQRVAQSQVDCSDQDRESFLQTLHHRLKQRGRAPSVHYDLMINTGKVSIQQATQLITDVARSAFRIPIEGAGTASAKSLLEGAVR